MTIELPVGGRRRSARAPVPAGSPPAIPVIDTGPDFPMATLVAEEARAHALLDSATRRMPRAALRSLDAVSRRWLARWEHGHLAEIDAIARRLDRPGAYFLSVNYEWGCTVGVRPAPEGTSARLVRVLDWRTPGLGRHVVAARVACPAGSFVTLTWPGYTGVLQALAKGRFAAALNQAPMRKPTGLYPTDWAANKLRVWRQPHTTPAHLLRTVLETAGTYAEARRRLIETPIAAPCIYALAGLDPAETCIIERGETSAHATDGATTAANHWDASGWTGRARGHDSTGRAALMRHVEASLAPDFSWMRAPILNTRTRLAMVADARAGRLVALGYEADGAATSVLELAD